MKRFIRLKIATSLICGLLMTIIFIAALMSGDYLLGSAAIVITTYLMMLAIRGIDKGIAIMREGQN